MREVAIEALAAVCGLVQLLCADVQGLVQLEKVFPFSPFGAWKPLALLDVSLVFVPVLQAAV